MHGQTEILGALPEAGAHSGGEFPTLTCKTCILCDTALAFRRPSANTPLAPLMCGRRQEGKVVRARRRANMLHTAAHS